MAEAGVLVILFALAVIYGLILVFEEKVEGDYDEILEAHCKKCIHYSVCRNRKYNCKEYITEEMLQDEVKKWNTKQ